MYFFAEMHEPHGKTACSNTLAPRSRDKDTACRAQLLDERGKIVLALCGKDLFVLVEHTSEKFFITLHWDFPSISQNRAK